VQDKENRDRTLDTLLARGLRPGVGSGFQDLQPTTPSNRCPAPELLAAFVERNLSKPEAQRLELHLAGCSRCQAQMAAMIRSLDAAEPAPRHTIDLLKNAWRWLAPLAAAALVILAVWVVEPELVRESREPRRPLTTTGTPVPDESERAAEQTQPETLPEPPRSPAPQPGRVGPQGREAVTTEENRAAAFTAPAQPRSETSAEDIARRVERQEKQEQAASREAARPQSAAPAERSAGRGGTSTSLLRGGTPVAESLQLIQGVTIAAPNPAVQWRFRPPAVIERSTDGGASWQVQVAEAPSELLAGSAPSDVVCWVVGRGGVVMRTVDGIRWERVTAPTANDLVGVVASDAATAMVSAATGQRYQTTDGGRSWTRL